MLGLVHASLPHGFGMRLYFVHPPLPSPDKQGGSPATFPLQTS